MIKLQFITCAAFFCFLFSNNTTQAQSISFNNNHWQNHILDRLASKNNTTRAFIRPSVKPSNRKETIDFLLYQDSLYHKLRDKSQLELSAVDRYNYYKILLSNTEQLDKLPDSFLSKKPLGNNFYTTKANLFEVRHKDLRLVINPVIQQIQSLEASNSKRVYLNAKGLEMRGVLKNKIGFYTYVTDNQENGPEFYAQRVDSLRAAQGVGFYKRFKYQANGTDKGQDYFDYRGYITFDLAKTVNVQYGYDKNFIGHGYRSLFLSDHAAPMLFLKLNTKVWKLDYTNIFAELAPTTLKNDGSAILQKKYMAVHHLNVNVSDAFSFGLFESVVFKRRNKFEFGYLVPVIFYRAVESGLGSGDNATVGADFKVNIENQIQIYGQALLDEFNLGQLRKKSWANKIGVQAGLKYFDVGGIQNLDFQLEWNIVRPYTYSHFDSATTYTHYNQPLAHPLGANFSDVIAIARYQPKPRLFFEGKLIFATQGQDSSLTQKKTWGANIFRSYIDRPDDVPHALISRGLKTNILNFNIVGSYEVRPNLYLEGNLFFRNFNKVGTKSSNTLMLSAGVRWNMNRRDYDY